MRLKLNLLLIVCLLFMLPQCSGSKNKYTTKAVKPKYHHRWFDRKSDKRTKRTKTVKVKN